MNKMVDMNNRVYVSKHGGKNLTLGREDLTKQINKIILDAHGGSIIFVISALAGVTRLLDAIFVEMLKKNIRESEKLFHAFTDIHLKAVGNLLSDNNKIFPQMEKYFAEIWSFIHKKSISNDPTMDQAHLLKYGELCSSLIFSEFISSTELGRECLLLDARNMIVSNSHSYVSGKVDLKATVENVKFYTKKNRIIVTQGFIARDADGRDIVLGYDGSDLTATVIAYSLLKSGKYVYLAFWKDVLGVLINIDDISEGVRLFMSIFEYLQFFDGKDKAVVLLEAIQLLAKADPEMLTIAIKSFNDIDGPGTIIRP